MNQQNKILTRNARREERKGNNRIASKFRKYVRKNERIITKYKKVWEIKNKIFVTKLKKRN